MGGRDGLSCFGGGEDCELEANTSVSQRFALAPSPPVARAVVTEDELHVELEFWPSKITIGAYPLPDKTVTTLIIPGGGGGRLRKAGLPTADHVN